MSEGDSKVDLLHGAGTSAVVWSIRINTFCKVKAWCEEMELERESIRFGQNIVPGIPIPKVIHTWIDREWNRSFLIWHQLSTAQKMHIAYDIAQYTAVNLLH